MLPDREDQSVHATSAVPHSLASRLLLSTFLSRTTRSIPTTSNKMSEPAKVEETKEVKETPRSTAEADFTKYKVLK